MRLLKFIYLLMSTLSCLLIALPVLADKEQESMTVHSQSQARYDQCVALHSEKNYREAIPACTDAIKIAHRKNLSFLYGYRASSYHRLGDKENAKKDIEAGNKTGGDTTKFVYMVLGDEI